MKPITFIDWHARFSKADARACQKMLWFAMPTELEPFMARKIADHPHGSDILAGYLLLLQIAARAPVKHRGKVVDGKGNPLSLADLRLMTGFPCAVFERAIAFFSQPSIAEIDASGLTAGLTADCQPTDSHSATTLVATVQYKDKDTTVQDTSEKGVQGDGAPQADAPTSEGFALALEEPKPKRKPTVAQNPPTEDEVIAYAATLKTPMDELEASKAFCHYASAGWKSKAGPMSDWKLAIRKWAIEAHQRQQRGQGFARKPSVPAEWSLRKDIREIEERIESIRDGIMPQMRGSRNEELYLSEHYQRELADLRARRSDLVAQYDQHYAATPAPSRAVS